MLASLKHKALGHLRTQYGQCEHDKVGLYFHFPYPLQHVTLHLHMRLNQGLHPLERAGSFTIDELIEGLSAGKSIDDIILERQTQTGGFHRFETSTYQNVPGLSIEEGVRNPFRLTRRGSSAVPIPSKDDADLVSHRNGKCTSANTTMDDLDGDLARARQGKRPRH